MIDIEIRNRLCNTPATLDGKPANICGRLNQFAIVRTLDGTASAEFSWPAVARIVASGAAFKA